MVSTNYDKLVREYEDIVGERDLLGFAGLVGAFTLGAGGGLLITGTVADLLNIPSGDSTSTNDALKLTGVTLLVTLGLGLAGSRVDGAPGAALSSMSLGLMVFTSFFLLGALGSLLGIESTVSTSELSPSGHPIAQQAFNSA